jgi:hypothetical protein
VDQFDENDLVNPRKPVASGEVRRSLYRRRILLSGLDTAGFLTGLRDGFLAQNCDIEIRGREDTFAYGLFRQNARPETPPGESWRQPQFTRMTVIDSARRRIYGVVEALNRVVPAGTVLKRIWRFWKAFFLLRKLQSFDAIVYNHGETVSGSSIEPYLLKKFTNVRIVTVFHGSDVRPVYLNGAMWGEKPLTNWALRRITESQFRLVRRAEKTSDAVVTWAGNTHFFAKPLFLHEKLGFPIARSRSSVGSLPIESAKTPRSKRVRILHMPSKPSAKGSDEISRVVGRLIDRGLPIDFKLCTGLPNTDALEEIQKADLVIDQIYSDSSCGVLAAEASLIGRPAIIASKDQDWLTNVLGEAAGATIFIKPDELENIVERLVTRRDLRDRAANAGLEYVKENWNPENVAKGYLEILFGEDDSQATDPLLLQAGRGGFATTEQISRVVTQFVGRYGAKALRLEHNIELRNNVLAEFRNR